MRKITKNAIFIRQGKFLKNDEIFVKIAYRSEPYDCTENKERKIWTESSRFTEISNYLMRKRARNARSPRNSANARAISIFDLISLAAFGLRPIAFIAPRPISPIPIPGPIRAIRAIPFARDTSSIIKNVKKYKNPGNQEGIMKISSLFYF